MNFYNTIFTLTCFYYLIFSTKCAPRENLDERKWKDFLECVAANGETNCDDQKYVEKNGKKFGDIFRLALPGASLLNNRDVRQIAREMATILLPSKSSPVDESLLQWKPKSIWNRITELITGSFSSLGGESDRNRESENSFSSSYGGNNSDRNTGSRNPSSSYGSNNSDRNTGYQNSSSSHSGNNSNRNRGSQNPSSSYGGNSSDRNRRPQNPSSPYGGNNSDRNTGPDPIDEYE